MTSVHMNEIIAIASCIEGCTFNHNSAACDPQMTGVNQWVYPGFAKSVNIP